MPAWALCSDVPVQVKQNWSWHHTCSAPVCRPSSLLTILNAISAIVGFHKNSSISSLCMMKRMLRNGTLVKQTTTDNECEGSSLTMQGPRQSSSYQHDVFSRPFGHLTRMLQKS